MRSALSKPSWEQQHGITLIEVLVSMVIFSVGILGMSALQLRVLQETHDQKQRDVAIWRAQALIDRIAINNSAAALNSYVASINNPDFCDDTPATICAETYDIVADAEVAAAVCSATQMAVYDSWELLCVEGDGVNDQLANLTPALNCNAVPCVAGSTLTLQLTWASYASTADPRLTGNTTIVRSDNTTDNIAANLERYRQVFIP